MVLCAGTGKWGAPRSLRRAGSSRERLTGTLPRALAQPVPCLGLIAGPRLLRWSASHQLGLSASLYAFVLSRVALLGSSCCCLVVGVVFIISSASLGMEV